MVRVITVCCLLSSVIRGAEWTQGSKRERSADVEMTDSVFDASKKTKSSSRAVPQGLLQRLQLPPELWEKLSFLSRLGLTFYHKDLVQRIPRIDYYDEAGDTGETIEYSIVPLAEWLQSDRPTFTRIAHPTQAVLDAYRGQAVMMHSSDFNNVTFAVNTIGEEALEAPEYRAQSELRHAGFNRRVYSLFQRRYKQELGEQEPVSAQK